MLLSPLLATNKVVSLSEILACRELRQFRQQNWLSLFNSTVISLTIVMPGAIKDSPLSRQIFNLAWPALQHLFIQHKWPILAQALFIQPTGAEALITVDLEADKVKLALIELEQHTKVGRLWDIDVLNRSGQILSRQALGYQPRSCLLCSEDAKVCARQRRHDLQDLVATMEQLVYE